ncbi:hypothetical protein ZIOFF_068928 [Zingiber officinale]|uniref:Uncharacterized protein n=1 Tax=Zingiber officinale TaxID=94328 RepID=A0A8J5EU01_ZINOF|nr:hypothetical protein ZIOFF_068928 [Zingiber officinale]
MLRSLICYLTIGLSLSLFNIQDRGCDFFLWHDPELSERTKAIINHLKMDNKKLQMEISELKKYNSYKGTIDCNDLLEDVNNVTIKLSDEICSLNRKFRVAIVNGKGRRKSEILPGVASLVDVWWWSFTSGGASQRGGAWSFTAWRRFRASRSFEELHSVEEKLRGASQHGGAWSFAVWRRFRASQRGEAWSFAAWRCSALRSFEELSAWSSWPSLWVEEEGEVEPSRVSFTAWWRSLELRRWWRSFRALLVEEKGDRASLVVEEKGEREIGLLWWWRRRETGLR